MRDSGGATQTWKDAFDEDIPPDSCLLVNKALYGGKQSGRCWYFEFVATIKKFGLIQSINDQSLFYNEQMIMIIYVDDALISCLTHKVYDNFAYSLIDIILLLY